MFTLVSIVEKSLSVGVDLKWVNFTFKSGTYCTKPVTYCRTFTHLVFEAAPSAVTNKLVGGGVFSLDGNPIQSGGFTAFEAHLVEDSDGTQAQMWNWGYDAVHSDDQNLPKEICASVWMKDLTTPGQISTLDTVCRDLPVAYFNLSSHPIKTIYAKEISAATFICNSEEKICRTNVHVVFHTTAGVTITDPMIGGALFSFDGGDWQETGSTYYEQHIDSVTGTLYQAMQADYDSVSPQRKNIAPKNVCFKVWVMNQITGEKVWLETDSTGKNCLQVCPTLHPFHTPYCP